MRWLRASVVRLIAAFRADSGRDFDDEVHAHLRLHIADNTRAGMSAAEARRQALLCFGGIEASREQHRERFSFLWLDALLRDLRLAARVLRRSPAFTATTIAILAVTLGVNTAVFTVVDHVLLRPLPYPAPDRLGLVVMRAERTGAHVEPASSVRTVQDGATWFALRDSSSGLDLALAGASIAGVNLVANAHAEHVQQQRVSAGFFRVLGVHPAIGREFTSEEDQAGGPAVVLLSHHLWARAFDANPSILGTVVTLRGEPFTVVGVMPPGFRSTVAADLWTPLQPTTSGEGRGANYLLLARPGDGIPWTQAEAHVAAIGGALLRDRFRPPPDLSLTMTLAPLQKSLTADLQRPIVLLWAAVVIVLLIGCTNIAGLLLVRFSARSREVAVCMALGGGRAAVARQLLVESLLLAAGGCIAGLGLAWVIVGVASAGLGDVLGVPMALDRRVALAAGAAALFTGVLFGLLPAWQAVRDGALPAVVGGGAARIVGAARRWPARALVGIQVALGVVLVAAAGLLLQTFTHLVMLPSGFDGSNVMSGTMSLRDARYQTSAQVNDLFDRSLEEMRRIAGVESAAIALTVPYERALNQGWRFTEEASIREEVINLTYVTTDYFGTLRIPVVRGRAFTDRDVATSPMTTVVNQAFVRQYSPDRDPIGRRISFRQDGPPVEIVGVVGNTLQRRSFGGGAPLALLPGAYIPATQMNDVGFTLVHTWFSPSWIVRTMLPPAVIVPAMRNALQAADPDLPFHQFRRVDDVRDEAIVGFRVQASVLSALAGLALLLATMGVYGLVSELVAQRRRELGVRMALGATPIQVAAGSVLPVAVLAVAAIALGVSLAYSSVGILNDLVFGVAVNDPGTLALAAAAMLLTACLAALVPAVRASRGSPNTALREL